MILNMSGGSSPVTVVDFSLSEDISVSSSGVPGTNVLTIENVFIPGNDLHGFVIQSLDVASNYPNSVSHIYTDLYQDGEEVTRLRYVQFSPSGGAYTYTTFYNPNSNAYIYDSTERTLVVGTASAGAIMKAGKYRLMIW